MSSEPRDQYLAVCAELECVTAERDALAALLREAKMWVREFDGDDSDSCLCNRISLALKDKP